MTLLYRSRGLSRLSSPLTLRGARSTSPSCGASDCQRSWHSHWLRSCACSSTTQQPPYARCAPYARHANRLRPAVWAWHSLSPAHLQITFGWTDGQETARDSWFVAATRDIAKASEVWLSDHIYLLEDAVIARAQIHSTPELRARLWALIGTAEEGDPEPSTDELLNLIAPFAHPIKLASPDPAEPSLVYHYVADEFGSRITMVKIGDESQEPPNIKMAAFYDGCSHQTYCVLWPCADIAEGECLRRCVRACHSDTRPSPTRTQFFCACSSYIGALSTGTIK